MTQTYRKNKYLRAERNHTRTPFESCLHLSAIVCLVACTEQACDRNGRHAAAPSRQEGPGPSENNSLRKTDQHTPKSVGAMPNSKPNAAGDCPNFAPAEHVGTVTGKSLSEISGIVSSRRQQDVFWVHNDSGNTPRVYALDRAGKQLAAITLPVEADDWEDIARGRHQGEGNYLYLADTGDNLGVRESIVIHRFREPTLRGPSTPRSLKKTAVETMRARYPDGPHDAEALFVDPVDDSLYLITKPKFSSPQLYRALRFEETATFTFETTLSLKATGLALKWVTGADISADGTWIAVRTYAQIALFKRRPHMTVSEALSAPGCVVNPPAEQQGEAISFVEFTTHQSSSPPALVTVSEGNPTSLFWLTPEKPE